MKTSTNYGLKLPEGTDNVKRQDLVDNFESIDTNMKELATSLSDLTYQVATGTATAITLTMQTLVNGYAKTFIAASNNNGTATTINGKPLYKPGTTTAPNLIAGKAYTVWYNTTSSCFFIKASAEGTVLASQVLKDATYSTEIDTGLKGTMPDNGALNKVLAINGTYSIPAGYTSGGQVTQSIPTKAAATINPSTAAQIIAAGQYLSGIQTILGDADLISANIKAGANIFNVAGKSSVVDTADATALAAQIIAGYTAYKNGAKVTGTATIASLGGKQYKTGSFYHTSGITDNIALPFTPTVVLLRYSTLTYMVYGANVSANFFSSSGSVTSAYTCSGNTISVASNVTSNTITYYAWA